MRQTTISVISGPTSVFRFPKLCLNPSLKPMPDTKEHVHSLKLVICASGARKPTSTSFTISINKVVFSMRDGVTPRCIQLQLHSFSLPHRFINGMTWATTTLRLCIALPMSLNITPMDNAFVIRPITSIFSLIVVRQDGGRSAGQSSSLASTPLPFSQMSYLVRVRRPS